MRIFISSYMGILICYQYQSDTNTFASEGCLYKIQYHIGEGLSITTCTIVQVNTIIRTYCIYPMSLMMQVNTCNCLIHTGYIVLYKAGKYKYLIHNNSCGIYCILLCILWFITEAETIYSESPFPYIPNYSNLSM